jgi:hypothetical protein
VKADGSGEVDAIYETVTAGRKLVSLPAPDDAAVSTIAPIVMTESC